MIHSERIIRGHGTPVRLVERGNGGLLLIQGSSHIALAPGELRELAEAIVDHLSRPRILRYAAAGSAQT